MPFNAPPQRRRAVRQAATIPFGPFIGMRDSQDPPVSNDPQRAFKAENVRLLELDKPSVYIGIAGFDQAGAQLGAAGKRTVQLIYQFTTLAGVEYTAAIVGGQGIYTYDWTAEAWTQVVTVANLTSASITLSETTRCSAVTIANTMVVSDGVNVPWSWTGASGAGGLTSLTAAPVVYGQPTIYYNKIIGIKNTERNVVVNSEESDPTIGYETAPYSNSWQLGQTDQEGFYAIVGTNERLYYLRGYSSGAISGAITPEFQSDGTKEGVDETIGTLSPWGWVYRDKRVFFLDARARPHAIVGGTVVPMWQDIQETLRGVDTTAASLLKAIAIYDPSTQLVLFGVVESGQTNPSLIIAMNPVLNVPVAVWRGYTFTALAVVKNGSGVPTIMHGADDGYTYDHGQPDGTLWSNELNSGTVAIRHTVEGAHLGVDARYEKRFPRMDLVFRSDANATGIAVSYTTPYGQAAAVTTTLTGGSARYGTAIYGTDVYGYSTQERHKPFGFAAAVGRWIRPRVTHEVAGERFGFAGGVVSSLPAGDGVLAP